MDLYIYSRSMELLGIVDEIESIIWHRKYSACGTVKMLVPSTEYHARVLRHGNIIMRKDSDEAAEIGYIHIEKDTGTGKENIEVGARFLLSWLDKRIVQVPPTSPATVQNLIYDVVRKNVTAPSTSTRRISELGMNSDAVVAGQSIPYAIEPFSSVLTAVEELAEGSKIGVKVISDMAKGTHKFSVYKGRDLTADNTEGNVPCVFSEAYDNIEGQEYEHNTATHKTTAVVGGEEQENVPRKFVTIGGEKSGLDRMEVFVDASDLQSSYQMPDGQTVSVSPSEYLRQLTERGTTELKTMGEEIRYTVDVSTMANLEYKKDFDLGDRVTCINGRWGIRADVRIVEIIEVYEQKKRTVECVFGASVPKFFKRIKQLR